MNNLKKEISLKYGNEKLKYKIEESKIKKIITANASEKIELEKIIKNALVNPTASNRLKKIVKEGETATVVISDITRGWQQIDKILPFIIAELKAGGIKFEDIHILAATGSHRFHTESEIKTLLGDYYGKIKFSDHDGKNKKNLKYLGDTSYGTPVWINKLALEADRLILTGGIIFHDLAGFAGGRKSILPGIAAYESIMENHSLAMADQEGEGIKKTVTNNHLKDNPVNLDMIEAAEMVDVDFILNVIPDADGGIAAAVAGDLFKAHQKGCKICAELFGIELEEKADLIFASCGGYPKDINLYQGSKSLVNAAQAVKENGYLILLSECREGIGHSEVEEIIQNYNDNLARENFLRSNFTISRYTGYLITQEIEDINLILVSELDQNILNSTDIKVVKTLKEALKIVETEFNELPQSYIMPAAANTLPIFKD